MIRICPACNGLLEMGPHCRCGKEMADSGPVTDYAGPYSPYYNICFESTKCIHLFTCPDCGEDIRLSIPLRPIH